MSRLQFKHVEAPDEVRRMTNGRLEIFNLDDLVFGRHLGTPAHPHGRRHRG
jgi:hypothetical protein